MTGKGGEARVRSEAAARQWRTPGQLGAIVCSGVRVCDFIPIAEFPCEVSWGPPSGS